MSAEGVDYVTQEALASGLAGKADKAHTHAQADITGLADALAGKADATLTVTAKATAAGWTGRGCAVYAGDSRGRHDAGVQRGSGAGRHGDAGAAQGPARGHESPVGQAAGSVTLVADGRKPEADLPVVVMILG